MTKLLKSNKQIPASTTKLTMKDLFGKAILDYQTHNNPENIITSTSISEEDEMQLHLRNFKQFKETMNRLHPTMVVKTFIMRLDGSIQKLPKEQD